MHPEVVADGGAILIVEVDRIQHLAVYVKLELAVGSVAQTHRPRPAVALEMGQDRFI
jgi:hypothetical protein